MSKEFPYLIDKYTHSIKKYSINFLGILLSLLMFASCSFLQQKKGVEIVTKGDKNALYYNFHYSFKEVQHINLQVCILRNGCCAQETIPCFILTHNERLFLFDGTSIQTNKEGIQLNTKGFSTIVPFSGNYVAVFRHGEWHITRDK